MVKGLIGKKIGMTQIFDDERFGNSCDRHRSWAMLRYPGSPARKRWLFCRPDWVSAKPSRSASQAAS